MISLTSLKLDTPTIRLRCSVCQLADAVRDDKKESEALEGLLKDREWSLPALSRAFAEQGYRISVRSLERHIGGTCSGRLGKGHLRGYSQ